MTAHNERGSEACRRRHMYSISLWGSSKVFSTSMKEERSLTPGGPEGLSDVAMEEGIAEGPGAGWGGGGGGG